MRRWPAVTAALLLAAAGTLASTAAAQTGGDLVGTFRFSGGCSTGSYFRMILPTGTTGGPFVSNADSTCADQTYTPLSAGSDGGLVTGGYQPEPSPAFDASGNSLSGRLTQPVGFYGVHFSTSTNPTDPQTGSTTSAPQIGTDGSGSLSGDLDAFAASWNSQEFNQGSPKPGGSRPGLTSGPSGTYDRASGAFTLDWTSQIVGGPFNSFTGLWHLAGTFSSRSTSVPPASSGEIAAAPAPSAAAATSATTAPPAVTDSATPVTASGETPPTTGPGAPSVATPGDERLIEALPAVHHTRTPVPLWVGVALLAAGLLVLAAGGATALSSVARGPR